MKKVLSFLVLFPIMVFGQSQDQNYIKTITYKVETSVIPNPTEEQKIQNITYFDGLGRPIQQVQYKQSGSGKDIITPIEYDNFGRQTKEYLPYVPNGAASLDFKSNALTDVLNYPDYLGQNPFSEKILESSPLNRIMKQAAPGNLTSWAKDSGHEIKFDYQTNTATEVKLFSVTATWNGTLGLYDNVLTHNGSTNYQANELYKTITYDENANSSEESDKSTIEFKNKEGQLVLKRTYGPIPNSNSIVPYDTYYVYDQYGNLTYVIPPLAEGSVTTDALEDLCYQYKYDYRNRLVEKKLPGKQWEFIIYDKLDRVVMTGPVFPPFSDLTRSGWMITKYDVFNRAVLTGWMSSASTITSTIRKTLQDQRNAATTNFNESRLAEGVTDVNNIGAVKSSYSSVALPTSGYYILTITYYDDYNYFMEANQSITIPSLVETQPVFYNNTVKPKGLVTGRWVRVISTTNSIKKETSYTLYDYKSRPIRTFVRNYETSPGGNTQVDTKYDFAGKIEYTVVNHKRINSDSYITIRDNFSYTNQDRLLTHTQKIGTSNSPEELLEENTYDELGQLMAKKVGNTSSVPLQKVDYTYNIRGWLTGINNDASNNLILNTTEKDLFAFKINYNTVEGNASGVTPLYNGNIAETYWRTASDNALRKYGYVYDNLNRLNDAIYQKPENVNPNTDCYNEYVSYDKNGNIIGLSRYGDSDAIVGAMGIDFLAYVYEKGNQLKGIADFSNDSSGFNDDSYNSFDDYTYDDNGNLKTDRNKDVSVVYNHMNLPIKIAFGAILGTNLGTIEYIYNADGKKIEKKVTQRITIVVNQAPVQSTLVTTTKYLEGFQYVDNVLQYFPTTEGYVTKTGSTYNYVYQYKDHLGNIRLSYQDKNKNAVITNDEILEENNYYPFGLKHNGYNNTVNGGNNEARKKLFGNKEFQDELDLNVYDFEARVYSPDGGPVFWQMDPLAEKFPNMSPYAFCNNNPLFYVDPTGMAPDWHRNGSGTLVADAGDTAESLAKFTGMSVQEARAEFNHNYYRFESTLSGGETFYNSPRAVSSGDYGPSYGPEKDLQYSLTLVGAIAAPILAVEGGIAAGASYLWGEAVSAYSQMTVGSYATGVAVNTVSQGVANGGDLSKTNIIEAGASGIPGLGPTLVGSTFNYNFAETDKGIQTPKSFEQATLQIGGGVIGNKFGKMIDANKFQGAAKVYGEVSKVLIGAGTGTLTKLAKK